MKYFSLMKPSDIDPALERERVSAGAGKISGRDIQG
jgi:hypothetical protein